MHIRWLLAVLPVVPLAVAACSGESNSRDITRTAPATHADAATPSSPALAPTAHTVATRSAPASVPTAARALADRRYAMQSFSVPAGSRPHDVAPAADGGIWYTAQGSGELGWLDPRTGATRHIDLGPGSAPHGVIVDAGGAPWITDSGLNAIVRVDPATGAVDVFALPAETGYANLNTAVFGNDGTLWFTGQSGIYGRLDPVSGKIETFLAPGGRGPYGITVTPNGIVYYASLAGSHVAAIDPATGAARRIDPPTPGQGARRVWSDSVGNVWVSEWNTGKLARYSPATREWSEWRLPGERPQAYAVYVDKGDGVWLTDFDANALVFFDPRTEKFTVLPLERTAASVRQLHGRPGEVWGAESGTDRLVVVRW